MNYRSFKKGLRNLGEFAVVGGILAAIYGGYKAVETNGPKHIDFPESEVTQVLLEREEDRASRLLIDGQLKEMSGKSHGTNWGAVARDYKKALEKYSAVVREFPDTEYADRAQKEINDLYIDPVICEGKDGDFIPVGSHTLVIDKVHPRKHNPEVGGGPTHCLAWVNEYDEFGNRIDKHPFKFSTSAVHEDLTASDYKVSDFLTRDGRKSFFD